MLADAQPGWRRRASLLPTGRPLLSRSAAGRVLGVAMVLVVLWLAVAWAVAVP